MEYPIMEAGKRAGSVKVYQEGLFTVFEAKCGGASGLVRLSVYGGGREGYLGVMQPGQGGLYLRRRLSRAQMKGFPERIEFAAKAGMAQEKPRSEDARKPCEKAVYWHRYSDGSLICRDGGGYIIALPASEDCCGRGAVLREIEGRLYMLFRY